MSYGTTQSPHGKYLSPVFYVVMADSDVGKTWDELNTWRYKGEYDGDGDTIRRVAGSMGLDQQRLSVHTRSTLRDTIARLEKYKRTFPDKKVPLTERPIWALIGDDVTIKLQEDREQIDKTTKNGWAKNDKREALFKDLLRAQRGADCHVHLSFHHEGYRPASVDEKGKVRPERKGGVIALGPKTAKLLTASADVVVRAGEDSGRWPRPVAFLGQPPNRREHTKDRHNFFRGVRPMCTREVLLHLGYTIPPVDELEQDLTAKFCALAKKTGPFEYDDIKDAFRGPFRKLAAKHSREAVYLAMYNGFARAQIESGLSYFDDIFHDDFA